MLQSSIRRVENFTQNIVSTVETMLRPEASPVMGGDGRFYLKQVAQLITSTATVNRVQGVTRLPRWDPATLHASAPRRSAGLRTRGGRFSWLPGGGGNRSGTGLGLVTPLHPAPSVGGHTTPTPPPARCQGERDFYMILTWDGGLEILSQECFHQVTVVLLSIHPSQF